MLAAAVVVLYVKGVPTGSVVVYCGVCGVIKVEIRGVR